MLTGRPRRVAAAPVDLDAVTPATRAETLPIAMFAIVAGFISLAVCATRGYMLLYGDAVAHLGIARRIIDTRYPGLQQLGGVWLPLPHLLMVPFVRNMEWWQNGMAGAWPSLLCYVFGVMGFYRLGRRMLTPAWALAATAFYGLNANLLYLATTAMTEPLFLALLVWIVLMTVEFVDAVALARPVIAGARLLVLGPLIFAAVMTRYDGWVLGAAVWCVVAWTLWKTPALRGGLAVVFCFFTMVTVAGPVCWFAYNHVYSHDWLDFMRGPYSAKEIDRKTSPPGSHHYFGWHDPAWSLMLYARTAQVDAAWWETGWLVAAAALAGLWRMIRSGATKVGLLLWLPLPFYVYSISYGSVPIFIPQLYPHSFYNSRYGMEMLPAFALFGGLAVEVFARRIKAKQPLVVRVMQPAALMLVVLNTVLMAHATPLVLKEAMVNSVGRVAIEGALAAQLESLPAGVPIMIDASKYVGAMQRAEIPLKQVIGPDDYYKGLTTPAEKAAYVIAGAGDSVAQAVSAHPDGLTELTILCSSKEPCVRVYRSDRFMGGQ
jgi:hypothetical protein